LFMFSIKYPLEQITISNIIVNLIVKVKKWGYLAFLFFIWYYA